jgi:hypothetical protein
MAAWASGLEITLRVTGVTGSVMAGLLPGSRGLVGRRVQFQRTAPDR